MHNQGEKKYFSYSKISTKDTKDFPYKISNNLTTSTEYGLLLMLSTQNALNIQH